VIPEIVRALRIIRKERVTDPKHEDYQRIREWAGVRFNAEVISWKDINQRFRRNRYLAAKSREAAAPAKGMFLHEVNPICPINGRQTVGNDV
jgi:hypothetical protein